MPQNLQERIDEFASIVLTSYEVLPPDAFPCNRLGNALCELIAEIPDDWKITAKGACAAGFVSTAEVVEMLKADIESPEVAPEKIRSLHGLLRSAMLIRTCEMLTG
jgi:hypothetical protein